MDIEERNRNLEKLTEALSSDIDLVKFRSADAASYVFADQKGRSVEVSYLKNKLCVEYWEVSDDEYAAPVKETTFDDLTKTEASVRAWLLRES